MSNPKYMSVDGKIVPSEQATIHFLSPAAKYGASVFEGIRAYWNGDDNELYVFRLDEHVRRLRNSMKIMRFDVDYTEAHLKDVVLETIRANDLRQDMHIRLSALVVGQGLYDSTGPISLMCAALPSASKPLADKVTRVGISTYRRISDDVMPPRVKAGSNYQNARLGMLEVQAGGYDKVLYLTRNGNVAEGAGECVFVLRDGELLTPPVTDGILESITRQTVIDIAPAHLAREARQRSIDRIELYLAEEVFLVGSMAEVRPVVNIDGYQIADGEVGRLTTAVWQKLEAICRGTLADNAAWRTPVYGGA